MLEHKAKDRGLFRLSTPDNRTQGARKKGGAFGPALLLYRYCGVRVVVLTLARLKTWVLFVDHIYAAPTTDNAAVSVSVFQSFQ